MIDSAIYWLQDAFVWCVIHYKPVYAVMLFVLVVIALRVHKKERVRGLYARFYSSS